jgi:hypothetical protein
MKSDVRRLLPATLSHGRHQNEFRKRERLKKKVILALFERYSKIID